VTICVLLRFLHIAAVALLMTVKPLS